MLAWFWLFGAYVLGSIPFGLIIGTRCCGIDPRGGGSGNIGATNVARLCGVKWGVLVLVCDAVKGIAAVGIALYCAPGNAALHSLAALAAIMGHRYSAFMKFSGGKAVATTIGVFIPLAFFPLAGACVVCILVIWLSGFVSLGSLALVTALPIMIMLHGAWHVLPLALFLWALVFYTHRENIRRLLAHEEKRWLSPKTAPKDEKTPEDGQAASREPAKE